MLNNIMYIIERYLPQSCFYYLILPAYKLWLGNSLSKWTYFAVFFGFAITIPIVVADIVAYKSIEHCEPEISVTYILLYSYIPTYYLLLLLLFCLISSAQ